jgi:hypothetical protein
VEVNVVYNPRIHFSSYRSFAFRSDVEADGALLSDIDPELRLDLAQVNALLEIELRDIGLEQVAADDAELLASVWLGRTARGPSLGAASRDGGGRLLVLWHHIDTDGAARRGPLAMSEARGSAPCGNVRAFDARARRESTYD